MLNQAKSGFSFIELLVALAILAIVVMFAYPSYQRYVDRSHRAEGAMLLLQAANLAENIFLAKHSYENIAAVLPQKSMHGWYHLQIQADAKQYRLTAIPTVNDKLCQQLWINSQGARGNSGPGSFTMCW